jgi:F-type H+-transporting ATPase subunit gamma
MSESTARLRHQISGAEDLRSVVRTMKAVAAASISQYQESVTSLGEYYRTVQLGLSACFRKTGAFPLPPLAPPNPPASLIVVFGSDQGLVGQFNDVIAEFTAKKLALLPSALPPEVWAVGARVNSCLVDVGLVPSKLFVVPHSIQAITGLIGQILVALESHPVTGGAELHLFYHRSLVGAGYEPVTQRLLPMDDQWQQSLAHRPWPTKNLPEVMHDTVETLQACLREYLFVSLFQACAESLASENASRLAAMVRAEKNIGDLLENLNGSYRRLRQSGIDEELFDIISGFEALTAP